MIVDSFDPRTFANMEIALERACNSLRAKREKHEARRYIANKILECAKAGDRTLGGLTKAGRVAASELTPQKVAGNLPETGQRNQFL